MNRCRVVNQLDKPLIGNDITNDLISDRKYNIIQSYTREISKFYDTYTLIKIETSRR